MAAGEILQAFTQFWEHSGKNKAAEASPIDGRHFSPALSKNNFERFHDEATPGDSGGHYGDVNHIGPGAAEYIDHHAEDFAKHDEDHRGDHRSLCFQVEEEIHQPTSDSAEGTCGERHGPRAA